MAIVPLNPTNLNGTCLRLRHIERFHFSCNKFKKKKKKRERERERKGKEKKITAKEGEEMGRK